MQAWQGASMPGLEQPCCIWAKSFLNSFCKLGPWGSEAYLVFPKESTRYCGAWNSFTKGVRKHPWCVASSLSQRLGFDQWEEPTTEKKRLSHAVTQETSSWGLLSNSQLVLKQYQHSGCELNRASLLQRPGTKHILDTLGSFFVTSRHAILCLFEHGSTGLFVIKLSGTLFVAAWISAIRCVTWGCGWARDPSDAGAGNCSRTGRDVLTMSAESYDAPHVNVSSRTCDRSLRDLRFRLRLDFEHLLCA